MLKIGIIGLGFVGQAHYKLFKSKSEKVFGYDILQDKTIDSEDQVLSCDYIYVCLPTPMKEDGSCELSYIDDFFKKVQGSKKIFILKSTVPPGTTQKLSDDYNLKIIHSPEFLRANFAYEDLKSEYHVIFGLSKNTFEIDVLSLRREFYKYKGVKFCTSTESELLKYFTNVFLACKVLLMNSFYFTAEKYHADYDRVKSMMLSDNRLGTTHFNVPGPDGQFGFGGYCFPKDTNSFLCLVDERFKDLYLELLSANDKIRN